MILVENRLMLMHTGERLMNNNTTNESVEEIDQKRVRSKKRYTNWKFIAAGIGVIALLDRKSVV